MRLRETCEKKMQTQLNELKAEIDELQLNLELARQHYQLLKHASDEKWHEIKDEFEVIWRSMRELIKSVNSP